MPNAFDIYEDNDTPAPKTKLDDFNTWGDVFTPGSNWDKICCGEVPGSEWASAEQFEEEFKRVTERLNEALLQEFRSEIIPPKDLFADLKTLEPSTKSQMPVEFQARVLAAMRKQNLHAPAGEGGDSDEQIHGWAFFGPAGWSKSTLCTAWFAEFARQHIMDLCQFRYNGFCQPDYGWLECPKGRKPQPFWRINALNLIDENLAWQHRDFADKEAKQPRVSSAWIENLCRNLFHPCLYLEEVDKVRTDKTRMDILFDVINALYEYKGVLLLNSNLTKQEFTGQFGPEFARRIGEMCNIVDCFAQEIRICPPAKRVPWSPSFS